MTETRSGWVDTPFDPRCAPFRLTYPHLPVADARPDPQRLLATFLRLVRVDSPSRHEGALARVLGEQMQALGWSVEHDGSGPDGGNVIGAEACHSVDERISLAELERLTEWILAIVQRA